MALQLADPAETQTAQLVAQFGKGGGSCLTGRGSHSHRQEPSPSVQGVCDALRGGHRHLDLDYKTAAALERAFPGTGDRMLEEQAFTARAVTWAADRGIRQFIIAGAGRPAPAGQNPHETAQAAQPGAVTVYAADDPYTAVWNRTVIAEGDPLAVSVEASVTDPARIFGDPGLTSLIDLADPVCVVVPMVLHFARAPQARRILRGLTTPLAAGSTVAVSAWTRCEPEQGAEFDRLFAVRPVWRHSEASIARWMTAAELGIEPKPRGRHPGVVDARLWPHRVWAADELPARPAERIVVAVGVRD